MDENNPTILNILVVGFHHKMGCQVEFSYPPLIPGSEGKNECPSGWKYLPTLALPDGSHNFQEDTVYFNLPSLVEPTGSVYGVSCYRQIPVEKLKIRTADMTRSTVQKAVCCLFRLPIYGYIEVKLSLIADAFFDQGDFSNQDLLIKAHQQLNDCLYDDEPSQTRRHFYVGLSLREIVLHWRHKMLQLFKLFLLQRRVVCFGSPVRGMCVLILGMASLIPRLFEKGFQEVACVRTSRPLSPMPDYSEAIKQTNEENKSPVKEICYGDVTARVKGDASTHSGSSSNSTELANAAKTLSDEYSQQSSEKLLLNHLEPDAYNSNETDDIIQRSNSLMMREASSEALISLISVNPDLYRAPISIFASGNLCLPYLSLPYMDLLTDPSVLSYIIGTSNVLFQQKRNLSDVLIDTENANINVHDAELRRQLLLTTEDLRFMDYLLRHVQSPKEDAEGSEFWIREQFQGYILALLRTAVTPNVTAKDIDTFNGNFMQAFKRTQCFQEWYDVRPDMEFFDPLPAGHPFAGNLSVADMKLKIAQTMQNSESGRKINQAVNTTSRAVGGAISQARDVFSSWWSSIGTTPAQTNPTIVQFSPSQENEPVVDYERLQAADISVSYNNKSDNISVEMGVSVQYKSDMCTAAGDNSLDSAEEFKEDTAVGGGRAPTTVTQREGVVEIGKEAELLNKRDPCRRPSITNSCASVPLSSANPNNNDGVYIV